MSKAGASGGVRLQMAESGHEDEHANLLGDEGMRPGGGQVLKLGYPSTNLIPNSFFFFRSFISVVSSRLFIIL